MKTKIINILHHPPAYDSYRNQPRPKINWDTPNGNWVGIWGYDWQDIIGNYVLKYSDEFEYEVWQPDHRADKIYEHRFENGLVHKLFPTTNKYIIWGLRLKKIFYSPLMIQQLNEIKNSKNIILHISASYRDFLYQIIKKFSLPVLGQFYTHYDFLPKIGNNTKIFKKLHQNLINNYFYEPYLKKISLIFPGNKEGLEDFLEKFNIPVFPLDTLNFYIGYKKFDNGEKSIIKKELNIPGNKKVLFSSSRLVPIKQIDKVIEALTGINKKEYIYYISGHGDRTYENHLKNLIKSKGLEKNIFFIGYVPSEILFKYFFVCDLFITASIKEVGPASTYIAMIYQKPVITTDIGIGYEILKENNAGIYLKRDDYSYWSATLKEAINNFDAIKIVDKNVIDKLNNEENIAQSYIKAYKAILKQNYA